MTRARTVWPGAQFGSPSMYVQYPRTESDHPEYATVRLTGSPIARDLEKHTTVFTEDVKCWQIDSIGHGRTRPVSLCVGSTDRKSDRERLGKYTTVFTEGVKCWQIDSIGHGWTRAICSGVYLTDWKSHRQRLTNQALKTCVYLVLKAGVYYGQHHRTHRCTWEPQSQLLWP